MDKVKPALTILIPSFNGLGLLQKHLPSILNQVNIKDEVVIVDDASKDGTSSFIKSIAKTAVCKVRLLQMGITVRFAEAVNHGFLAAKNEYVFLCNNDVSLLPGCIDVLRSHTAQKNLFAVGCLEFTSTLEGEKSGKNKIWFSKGLFHHSKARDFLLGETAWVSGGSGLFSRQKWLQLDGFDTHFAPAYWEDVDIAFRAKQRGWQILFDPNAQVVHQHETTHSAVFTQKKLHNMSWEHSLYFTWKHARFWQKLQFLFWQPYWQYKHRKWQYAK